MVLAASAGNDLLQTTFTYLCAKANAATEPQPGEAPAPGVRAARRAA